MPRKSQGKPKLPTGIRLVERDGRTYYEGRLRRTHDDGTKDRISVFGKTISEAADKLARRRVEKRRASAPGKGTVSEFLKEWLKSIEPIEGLPIAKPRVRPNTYAIRKNAVDKRLVPTRVNGKVFGEIELAKLTRTNVMMLFDTLERSEPGNSRARQVAFETLRCAMNAAIVVGLVDANPCSLVPKPGHVTNPPHRLSKAEIFSFLEAARNTTNKHASEGELRYFALFQLALATGLREGEVFALHKADYDSESGYISVNATLTKRGREYVRASPKTAESRRTILLDRVTRAALTEHLSRLKDEGDESPWLFPTLNGNPNHRDRFIRRHFQPTLKRAGLDHLHVTFHALRHAAATTMQGLGISPLVVQMILGHRVPATLGRYTGLTVEMHEHYAEVMGDFFGTPGVQTGVPKPKTSYKIRLLERNHLA